jgi:hypothetical protein
VDYLQTTAIAVNAAIFFTVIELIRRNRLKERYSLMWLTASVTMIVFSWRAILHSVSKIIGIAYPPSFLFLLAILFLVILLLHFSTVISSLSEKNQRLAQEIGILKNRLGIIEDKIHNER